MLQFESNSSLPDRVRMTRRMRRWLFSPEFAEFLSLLGLLGLHRIVSQELLSVSLSLHSYIDKRMRDFREKERVCERMCESSPPCHEMEIWVSLFVNYINDLFSPFMKSFLIGMFSILPYVSPSHIILIHEIGRSSLILIIETES